MSSGKPSNDCYRRSGCAAKKMLPKCSRVNLSLNLLLLLLLVLVPLDSMADTIVLSSGTIPSSQAWVDGNRWQDLGDASVISRTLTLATGALPPGAVLRGLTVSVNFSKFDGPNCYVPSVAQDPGTPYTVGSGLWNSGPCPIEPTNSPNYPDNTTLNQAFPDEIYLAINAPGSGVRTVLVPTNRYIESGNPNYTNINVIFRDSAAAAIPLGSHPASGTFKPITPLSVYYGTSPQGIWTLTFGDNYSEDPLRINNWSVTIDYDFPATVTVRKITRGGIGTFSFTQSNLASNPGPITTVTPGTPVAAASRQVVTLGSAVTVTEAPASGFLPVSEPDVCSDTNSAVTGQNGRFGSIDNGVLTIPAA
ncbi:MAG: hypothetical protein WKG03_13795, partial [Telluria sp.]